ncbi:unnamed protein product [Linum tenue]|uniref:GDSL esterase/lipase n=1 Tax=Linum tenue TaxID=586396 RepID=A0AAV0H6Q4_9ROSI|nr:unnamed protein product [Linum tenue]CAI0380273.1 unnamed protein product [Linum tenue]
MATLHVLLACILALLVCSAAAAAAESYSNKVPAVFVFGDSLVDTGNNNYVATIAKGNFPPYGRDFPGGKATGRFSNAKGVADYIAEVFGVKQLLPPYLDPSLDLPELLTGVCFASAGSGYDPRTPQKMNAIPMTTQLNMFKEYIKKINASVSPERTQEIISQSAYVIFMGSNDLTNTYPTVNYRYTEESYTDLMISLALDFHKKLYEVGARRIGLLELPPTGCAPAIRSSQGGLRRECSESLNRRIRLFNSKLSLMVDQLNQELPGTKAVKFEFYDHVVSLADNPAPYGIEEVTRGCCGTGNIETGVLCVLPGTCAVADKYMFFDSFHPTEVAARILTKQALSPSYLSKLF